MGVVGCSCGVRDGSKKEEEQKWCVVRCWRDWIGLGLGSGWWLVGIILFPLVPSLNYRLALTCRSGPAPLRPPLVSGKSPRLETRNGTRHTDQSGVIRHCRRLAALSPRRERLPHPPRRDACIY